MKKLYLIIIIALIASLSFSAVSTGYSFAYTAGTYTENATGTALGTQPIDDTNFTALPIGFTFSYNGIAYTTFSINNNGFIAMGSTVANSYSPISSGTTNNIISAVGLDLQGNSTGSTLTYESKGVSPSKYLVVQWKNYREYGATGQLYNFQIVLYETSNKVEIIYGSFTNNDSYTCQVGLRGATSADFNNRTTTSNWAATTAGTLNSAACALTTTVFPASGTTYAWTVNPIYPEPTNHATAFGTGTLNFTTIQLNWTGAIGAQLPQAYLILAKTGTGSYASVADGVPVANDANLADFNAAVNVPHLDGANTYTFTGLTANSAYDFVIYPYTNSESNINFKLDAPIPTVNASTLDPTITSIAYTQNFDGVTAPALPGDWSKKMIDTSGYGYVQTYAYTSHSASNSAQLYNSTDIVSDKILISPPISPAIDLTTLRVRFWLYGPNTGGVQVGTVDVAGNSAIFTNVQTVIPATGFVWTEYTVNFAGYAGPNKYIAFRHGLGATYQTWYIDDVVIEYAPTTPLFSINPALTETWPFGDVVIGSTVEKSFTVSNSGPGALVINSIGTTDLYYSVTEIAPIDHSLEGTDTTTFKVIFQPMAIGSGFEGTVTVNYGTGTPVDYTIDFTGNCIPYGVSTATSPADDDIGQITLGTFANPTTAPTLLTSNPDSNQLYNDYTALGPIDIQKTVAAPFSLTQINSGGYYTCHFKVFIDYNQNQAFDLPDELALTGSTSTSYAGSNPFNGFITVPVTATEGNARMRVVLVETSDPALVLPVGTYSWGETEDYTVNITAPPAVITPSNLATSNVVGDSATLSWTENNTPPAVLWNIIYGAPGFDPLTQGTAVNGVSTNPFNLTSLSPSTSYQWYVRSDLGADVLSDWAGPAAFTTSQIPATLPLTEGWESGIGSWTVVNGTQTNQWFVGTADPHAGANSAYISNNAGVGNVYDNSATSVVHLYRDITFSGTYPEYPLSFYWKGMGESSSYDYLQVFLVDTSVTPVAGTRLTTGQIGSSYNMLNSWNNANINLPGTLSGTVKRLVFSWWNDFSGGDNPPINVDDINLIGRDPYTGFDILTYSIPQQTSPAIIDTESHTVVIEAAFGTVPTALIPSFTLSPGATAKVGSTVQVSGTTANDFTEPVTYIVEAEDGGAQEWIVTVNVATTQSSQKAILTYSLPQQTGPAVIDATLHTVAIQVQFGTNLTALVATFTISPLATVSVGAIPQISGTTPNNFTSPVSYTVKAEDASEQIWAVTVTVAPPPVISTFPWNENFDAALTAPNGWLSFDVDGGGTNWVGSTTYTHSAPNAFKHAYGPSGMPQDGWLITPAIAVPTGNYYLSWWNYSVYPSDMEYNGVKVNTTNDPAATGWTEIWSQDNALGSWQQAVASISAYAGQTVYFAFNYQGTFADDWYVDDVSVYELTVDTFGPVITHLPIINTPREDIGNYVVADIVDDASWNNPIGGANMYWSIDGGTTWSAAVPMVLGTAPTYSALIPAQALGTTVTYKIEAWDSLNNMTTTDNFSFGVNDPTWVWYDTGVGSFTWFGAGQAFSPIVVFENPFYGTQNAVHVNTVDGMAYDVNASTSVSATLHVYSWDGTGGLANFVDVSGPIAVTLDHQVYETFDLSTYNIQISTPYFLVGYDLPTGAAFLYDNTYDYGTTYVVMDGTLYTLTNPGAWSIGANVSTGASLVLPTPVVSIAEVAGAPVISWTSVVGANSYKIFGSADPYAADPWTLLTTVGGLTFSYTYPGTEGMKFFKVVANSATPTPIGPSFSLPTRSYRKAVNAAKAVINHRRN